MSMKYVVLLAMLFSPLSCAADYRQEILDYIITPCLKMTLEREGIDLDERPELLDIYIERFGYRIEENIEILQATLNTISVSDSERRQLYQIGLDSCLEDDDTAAIMELGVDTQAKGIQTDKQASSLTAVAPQSASTREGGAKKPKKPDEARQSVESRERQFAGEMVEIPGGTFLMGDPNCKFLCSAKPVHTVTVSAFKLGKQEVTFAQWDVCVEDGGCRGYWSNDRGWGRDIRPVIHVSWNDAQNFIGWLNSKTDGGYRLPTEAEWEYAARSGTTTKYSWGDDIGSNRANCNGCVGIFSGAKKTAPVGSYSANAWGLYDMHGNVAEWVEDCWNYDYNDAPSDGRAWIGFRCTDRVIRGGSWAGKPKYMRSGARDREDPSDRGFIDLGFRLAQDK